MYLRLYFFSWFVIIYVFVYLFISSFRMFCLSSVISHVFIYVLH